MSSYDYSAYPTYPSGGSGWLGWGVVAGIFLVSIFLTFIIYIYFAYCLARIAQKTGAEDSWWAWVPLLNLFLMFKIAGKPGWWVLLLFIPMVNLIVAVIAWMEIAQKLGKPNWIGLLVLLPMVGFFVPGYLAFSSNGSGSE